jgi:hypothetical protein
VLSYLVIPLGDNFRETMGWIMVQLLMGLLLLIVLLYEFGLDQSMMMRHMLLWGHY